MKKYRCTDRKKKFGDRYDGFRVRKIDPIINLMPVIMKSRNASHCMINTDVDIENMEKYIRVKRREDLPHLGILHVFVAALVRATSERPRLNRFIAGKKLYARNYIRVSLVVKKSMNLDADEAVIMPYFMPTDTIYDVYEKINTAVAECKDEGAEANSTGKMAKFFSYIPTWLLSIIVSLVSFLDYFGLMPKFINRASPFHSSYFITDIGSVGADAVYHHLYDFGTMSAFFAIGRKKTTNELDSDGNVKRKRCITIKIEIDERIADGFYTNSSLEIVRKYLLKPQMLETAPEKIVYDYS